MTNRIHKVLAAGLLSIFCSGAFAEISDASANRLLELSGLSKEVPEMPSGLKAGFAEARQGGARIPDEIYEQMLDAIDKSVLPSEMLKGIASSVKKSMNEVEAKRLAACFESDLGRKFTTAEEQGNTFEAHKQMTAEAQSLLSDAKRVAFAKKVDQLVGATDTVMSMQKNASTALYSALVKANDPDAPVDVVLFKKKMDEQMLQARPAIEQAMILAYVYNYRDFSIEELKKYETFLAEKGSVKFNKTVGKSIDREFSAAINTFAEAFASILKNNRAANKKSGS